MAEIEYHPEAEAEIVAALRWYAEIDERVAERFKQELERSENLVKRSPGTWGRYFQSTRAFRLQGFRL